MEWVLGTDRGPRDLCGAASREALRAARAAGDEDRARDIEWQLRAAGEARRIEAMQARRVPQPAWRRALGRPGVVGAVASVLVAVIVLLVGVVGHVLTPVWWIAALVLGGIAGAVMTLAATPNAPYHPDAGREDRAFNYVRGEGGGG